MSQQNFKLQDLSQNKTFALFVSLYLVLLAFFIVLNSISEKDENKTKQVMANVGMTFSAEKGKLERDVEPIGFLDSSMIIADFFEKTESFIVDNFKLVEIQKSELGTKMQIKFEIDDIFDLLTKEPIARRLYNFKKIVKMSHEFSQKQNVEVKVYINSPSIKNNNTDAVDDIEYISKVYSYVLESGFNKGDVVLEVVPALEHNIVLELEVDK